MVLGVIFVGVATPTEAAGLGVVGTALVAAMYGELRPRIVLKSLVATAQVTVVIMLIIVGSKIFSQILAFTGGSRGLVELVRGLAAPPLVVLVLMMLVVAVLGCFIDQISIMMITVPIFFPMAEALGFDLIWFGMLMLLNLEVASTTPPFGLQLFVLKGVVPDATMSDIYRSCLPFVLLDFLNLAIMIAFPAVVLTLPGLMFK
jgi:tripartite ATP-independent transporter DctM subunit